MNHHSLQSIASQTASFRAGDCARSEASTRCWIVASGWACYARAGANERRQIFSFILPGDAIGLADGPFEADKTEV
jgi:CRP-like cAMP-binding protein